MDPASAIGVATAVLSIVNLIAKNVASLSDLQSRYNAADLRISLLIGQLSTVKAALNQMVKLLESDFGALRDLELNYDFSMSIRCVEAAVVVLDDKMSLLQRNAANKLTLRSKVNLIWDEKTMDDYLNLLNNQIHALGLLLTALQCRTALEQSNLLQCRESRHVFDRVKDDTSSLLGLRDEESVHTYRSTGTQDLQTVNATFTFDSEILNSKVYQTATRSNMIYALLPGRRAVPNDSSSIPTSSLHSSSNFSNSSGAETVKGAAVDVETTSQYPPVSRIRRYYTIHNLETLRPLPRGSVSRYIPGSTQLPRLLEGEGNLSEDKQLQRSKPWYGNNSGDSTGISFHHHLGLKVLVLGISYSGKTTLHKSMKIAFEEDDKYWRLSYKHTIGMSLIYQDVDMAHMDCVTHYKHSASRIMRLHSNYIPTAQDILFTGTSSISICESQYFVDGALCRFFDVGGSRVERTKWSREATGVYSIIFTLDVSCYDHQYRYNEKITINRMLEQLTVWDGLVASKPFEATNFIVMFTKVDVLTPSKLGASPFNYLFPDYAGKPDSIEDILQYLARRMETASNGWGPRGLMFCNAGSIWDSPTNMAEVAVRALTEVGRCQSYDLHNPTFF